MTTKQKGSVAELAVAADLTKRGFTVAVPFGDYGDWDLLVDRHWAAWTGMQGRFERVQVKYATKKNGALPVRNRCHSVTAGRVSKTYTYNDRVDWIAVYEATTDCCYYMPTAWLPQSRAGTEVSLRVDPPKNGQYEGVKWAKDYRDTIDLDSQKQGDVV